MGKKFVLFGILASILIGGSFGIFTIEDSFAQDISDTREDSEAYKKQLEKAEERKLKAEEKQDERKLKAEERKLKAEEKLKKLEERKVKLELDRKRLEEKLLEKAYKYEEKLREIKEMYQNKIESNFSGDVEKFSAATAKLEDKLTKSEDKFAKKSEKIREKLLEKSEKLDSRTQKILDKINEGKYLGEKIGSSTISETYELVLDSVVATTISDKTQTSSLYGIMSFTTFDKGESNLKLELQECQITVDDVLFNCGFGKARTASLGDSEVKDSLVIIAFLEDDLIGEVHSTLKIFLNADIPISDIDNSYKVSILEPQSEISNMWLLDGTGTLTKIILDDSTDDSTDNEISVELDESLGITGNWKWFVKILFIFLV